jgi:hypothetical protein
MVCRNQCERLYSKIIVGKSPYGDGKRYCRRCDGVKSADNGIMGEPVLDVMCSL